MLKRLGIRASAFYFLVFLLGVFAAPAQAAVTIAFWSQETAGNFPHAFFTLYGTPDAGGAPVDLSYGFTAKSVSPAILLGTVAGKIDKTDKSYIAKSKAHFAVTLTDAQYHSVLRLVNEWGEKGDHRYILNRRNCVHFIAEAMRRSGLKLTEDPKLMKKPGAFAASIARLNPGRVAVIEKPAKQYWATLPPLRPGQAAGAP